MSRIAVSIVLSVALLSCLGTLRRPPRKISHWPLIQPLSWSGEMDLMGPPTLIAIHSTTGAITYRLYCSSWAARDDTQPKWLTAGDNYEGDFECLLTDAEPGTPAKRATLLNYDPTDGTPYHFNEGSFHWDELLGSCWNNPEWGSDRTFYLRGMRIRIHVIAMKVELYKDKKENKMYPIIRRVTANVTAEPDKEANTTLARPPAHDEPTSCLK